MSDLPNTPSAPSTPPATAVAPRPARRRAIGAVVASLFAALMLAGTLAGCSGEGTKTNCTLNACTVTFDRGVDARVEVLGIEAKLVGVSDNQATLEIGGQQVVVPVGGEAQAEGFNISVQEITDQNVVVRISGG